MLGIKFLNVHYHRKWDVINWKCLRILQNITKNMSLKTNMGIKSFFLDVITDWSFVLYYKMYCEDTTVKKPTTTMLLLMMVINWL